MLLSPFTLNFHRDDHFYNFFVLTKTGWHTTWNMFFIVTYIIFTYKELKIIISFFSPPGLLLASFIHFFIISCLVQKLNLIIYKTAMLKLYIFYSVIESTQNNHFKFAKDSNMLNFMCKIFVKCFVSHVWSIFDENDCNFFRQKNYWEGSMRMWKDWGRSFM